MKPINILYDDMSEDVDIVLIPDELANSIEQVVQEFWCWVEVPDNKKRFMRPDTKWGQVLSIDTKEFLWWLNNIKIHSEEKASIVQQHTSFVEEYPTAEF